MKPETLKAKADAFHARFEAELGEEYERISDFQGSHEMLTAKHIPCGEIRTTAARDFFRKGCPVCDRLDARRRRAANRATENIKQIEVRYGVTAKSEYTGMRNPMVWECNLCGSLMRKTIENILWRKGKWGGGITCDCQITHGTNGVSSGEFQIIRHLRCKGIRYMREVWFDDCRMDRPLPFDFVLYDEQWEPYCAIEYNGEQHYKPIDHWGGEDALLRVQESGRIKAQWCEANDIELIVIESMEDIEQRLKYI